MMPLDHVDLPQRGIGAWLNRFFAFLAERNAMTPADAASPRDYPPGTRLTGQVIDIQRAPGSTTLYFTTPSAPGEIFLLVDPPKAHVQVKILDGGAIEMRDFGTFGRRWVYLRPWPRDALMIVGLPANGCDSPNCMAASCRACGQPVRAWKEAFEKALENPLRRDKPVQFFCERCARSHDIGEVTHFDLIVR